MTSKVYLWCISVSFYDLLGGDNLRLHKTRGVGDDGLYLYRLGNLLRTDVGIRWVYQDDLGQGTHQTLDNNKIRCFNRTKLYVVIY